MRERITYQQRKGWKKSQSDIEAVSLPLHLRPLK